MGITIQSLLQTHFQSLVSSRRLSKDMWNAAVRLRDCRTSAMGIHVKRCPDGHVSTIAYNSCRHRCCQVCGALERERWLHRWRARLLPSPHHHVVFTIPHELLDLWRYNKRAVTNILFAAASQTLRELLADPKYCGARAGLLAALHTWSQTLAAHVQLHVLVTAGGLDAQQHWQPATKSCLLPRKVLMIVFRGKFRALVLKALERGELELPPPTSVNYWVGEMTVWAECPGTSRSLTATNMGAELSGTWHAIFEVARLATTGCLRLKTARFTFAIACPLILLEIERVRQ